jgi:predicted N-formylglutamate amidohydrolase
MVDEGMWVAGSCSEAVEVIGGDLAGGFVLLCDHASNALPPVYGTLGLRYGQLGRHIAYDIGAAGVTRMLAQILGVPAILTRNSRLLIDPNRGLYDPTLIMRVADGAVIPGNRQLDGAERERRIVQYYQPYHGMIGQVVDQALAAGVAPVLLAIHSFTPIWKGIARPWHAAVLWDKDPRLAHVLLAGLRASAGLVVGDTCLVVGDNEPYDGALKGDTLWQHGTARGLAHALLEVRQDLIGDTSGQADWAQMLAGLMRGWQADRTLMADMMSIQMFGSRTDRCG